MSDSNCTDLTRRAWLTSTGALFAGSLSACGGGAAGAEPDTTLVADANGKPTKPGAVSTLSLAGIPASGTVGVAAEGGTVTNSGQAPAVWSLVASSKALAIAPSSGTLAAGASIPFTMTPSASGEYSLTLVNQSGGSVSGSPATFSVAEGSLPATSVALSGSTSGMVDSPITLAVTANRAVAGTVTVTLVATGSAKLSAGKITLSGGVVSGSVTLTSSVAEVVTVTMTNSAGLTNVGSPFTVSVREPVLAGTWQQLTVAQHSRKVISGIGDGASAFDATKAIALEGQLPQLVSAIPARAFSTWVPGERGFVYLAGGLHSNYQGNEIDRIALPTGPEGLVMSTTISHQPNRPAQGPFSGYGGGQGCYIHRNFDGGLRDVSNWQPYPAHQWTMASWHPAWGYMQQGAHAVQASYPDGAYELWAAGIPLSSKANPDSTTAKDDYGVITYNFSEGKYKTRWSNRGALQPSYFLGKSGTSDYNYGDLSHVFIETNGGRTWFNYWRYGGSYGVQQLGFNTQVSGFDGVGGNGILIRYMEARKYLILRAAGSGTFKFRTKLFIWSQDFAPWTNDTCAQFVQLSIPSGAVFDCQDNDDALTFCVDRNSRRIFWLVFPGKGIPCRFYFSSFDAPESWIQLRFSNDLTVPATLPFGESWISANKQPIYFRDGYLFVMMPGRGPDDPGYQPDGPINVWRAKVDSGEDLPSMNFQRFDYSKQNFTFSHSPSLRLDTTKHANFAYRATTGEHIHCAGDIGSAYNPSMGKLVFDNTARGFTFSEVMSETAAAPIDPATGLRMKRPASPDDGAWFYSSPSAVAPSLRDKFIFVRGGDGLSYSSNAESRNAYLSKVAASEQAQWAAGSDTPSGIAAMQADGWTLERLLVFDPDKKGFLSVSVGTWAWDDGGIGLPHPTTLGAASTRCGAYDETTGCVFRITNIAGTLFLVRYDFVNRRITGWNISRWTDSAGSVGPAGRVWYPDGLRPTSQSIEPNGFGFFNPDDGRWHTAMPGPWEHKALWLDERDGKLYGVAPETGYLWCFETRTPEISLGVDGKTIKFYPVGARIPTVGTYPCLQSQRQWPPVRWDQPGHIGNPDVEMNSFLVPFKGGLLWWSSAHHDQGTFGFPRYFFWRRLGYNGSWTVVTPSHEFAANTYSVVSRSIDNTEVVMLCGGGSNNEFQGPWSYFWRLT